MKRRSQEAMGRIGGDTKMTEKGKGDGVLTKKGKFPTTKGIES